MEIETVQFFPSYSYPTFPSSNQFKFQNPKSIRKSPPPHFSPQFRFPNPNPAEIAASWGAISSPICESLLICLNLSPFLIYEKCCKFRVIKEVLGFLEAALTGCFFACFRIKNDEDGTETRLSTNSIPFKNSDRLVSKNHFDAVSLCEGKNLILEVYGRTAGLARYSGLVVFYFYFVVTILNKIFYLT